MVTDIQTDPVQANTTLRWANFMVNLNWWLGWFVAAMLVVLIVLMFGFDFDVHYSILPLEVTLDESSIGEVLEPIHSGSSVTVTGFRDLRVISAELPGMRYMMISPIILLVGYLWGIWLLRRFIGNVKKGEPFAPENPRLLTQIGWLMIIAEPVYRMLVYIYAKVYINSVHIPGATIEAYKDFNGLTIVAGLVILVLAQVYHSAVQIKTEADLTI